MAILTVEEVRAFNLGTDLGDDPLQTLLDATEAEIVAHAGPGGARTVLLDGGYRFISLPQPIDAITSISELVGGETTTVLAADDYRIRTGDLLLERLPNGTNPSLIWRGLVTVIYTPVNDDTIRKAVQLELLKLDLNANPGVVEERIGEWSQKFATSFEGSTPGAERDAILARLGTGLGMVVVSGYDPR